MYQGDAEIHCFARASQMAINSSNRNRAAGRAIDPRDQLAEGRFAGPVFADQAMNLAGHQVDVNVLEHLDARESHSDSAGANNRLGRRSHFVSLVLKW